MTEGQETTRYEWQVAGDLEMRQGVHELRKMYADADEGDENTAWRRYRRVAEMVNACVYREVRAWCQEVHDQRALVLALATSGVDVGKGWSKEDAAEFRATGEYGRRAMVEVLEIVLMELDGTVAYRQRVRPEFVPGGELVGTAIHRLTLKELAGEPGCGEGAADFRRAAGGRRVVCYNAPWAASVLAAESARWGVPEPVPGLGLDDCVMAQRSRFAAYYRVSEGDYRALALGSPDRTPEGVARTVCDVIEAYRKGYGPPEDAYDPWGRDDYDARTRSWGWRDALKPEGHETDAEWRKRLEREREEAEREAATMEELRAEGFEGDEEELRAEARRRNLEDWEDIPF